MLNRKTSIIVVLGGGLKKDRHGWRTTGFHELGDKFGSVGDYWRVLAASLLYHPTANQLFLTVGGRGQLKNIPDSPPVAEVIKKELCALGIPASIIKTETKSGNTYQQLLAIKKSPANNKNNFQSLPSSPYPRFFKICPGTH